MEDAVDLFGDGEFEAVFAGEREEGGGCANSFGDHGHAGKDFGGGAALAQFESHAAVAALGAVAGENEVTHSGEAAEGFGFAAESGGEARHFRESPGNQSSERVCSEAKPLACASGDGA